MNEERKGKKEWKVFQRADFKREKETHEKCERE